MKFIKLNNGVRINLCFIESYGKNLKSSNQIVFHVFSGEVSDAYYEKFKTEEQVNKRLREIDCLTSSPEVDFDLNNYIAQKLNESKNKIERINAYMVVAEKCKVDDLRTAIMIQDILNIINDGDDQ